MRRYLKGCDCKDLNDYAKLILTGKEKASEHLKMQYKIVKEEFSKGNIEVDLYLYDKYIKIGFLFFDELFLWQKASTALALCTFYKDTKKPRWNKIFTLTGRGNGKDGMIAWWSCCLTSKYHGVMYYDIDIIANNFTQSLRPIEDIMHMVERQPKSKNMKSFYKKTEFGVVSLKTNSPITARSSDAGQQDGLRSGAVFFNEIHEFKDHKKINVMKSGLGKKDDPRTFYFTTNGEVRGVVLDDMLEKANLILQGQKADRRQLYLLYELNKKEEVHNKKNWVMANPSLPYRETLQEEIEDEYEDWKENPNSFPAFLQKRFNIPEMPVDQEVVPWEIIEKTNQKYDISRLKGMCCVVGIDLSKTTDFTSVNFLFYDDEIEKFICINHTFICTHSRDLDGIKAPYQEWCNKGYATMVDVKQIDPEFVIDYVCSVAEENDFNIECIVIDDFKKGIMKQSLETKGFSKENENLEFARPLKIAPIVPLIESYFIQERLIFLNNRMLMWATNNTKVVPWKTKTTGDNDMGNQLYAKINPRFRKNDPFMAFVHSMIKSDILISYGNNDYENYIRGF